MEDGCGIVCGVGERMEFRYDGVRSEFVLGNFPGMMVGSCVPLHRQTPWFSNWEGFRDEFKKEFCLAHMEEMAINQLESTTYFQRNHSVDAYLDEFVDLIVEAGYTDAKTVVIKFCKGLDPQIQNVIATIVICCVFTKFLTSQLF